MPRSPSSPQPSRLTARRWLRRSTAAVALTLLCLIGFRAGPALHARLDPPAPLRDWLPQSRAVVDRDGTLLRLSTAADERYRLWLPLAEISPRLQQAMLLKEDQWFQWHPGVNPISLLRGAYISYIRRDAPQGGSTLTMQLARLMWQLDTRSPAGKLRQIGAALWLEWRYSKSQLLEGYLNLAPFGGNVEGIGAASLIYFNKSAAELTLGEALSLAVIPQNPSVRRADAVQTELVAQRDVLWRQWRERDPQAEAVLPTVLRKTRDLPKSAPHYADLIADLIAALAATEVGAATTQRGTLDSGLQRLVEERLRAYIRRNGRRGLQNAAAVLVDTRDMGVRAMVGSADFGNVRIAGQVNGTLAKRSPGSTLKPFIYALAIDQGQLHPASVLRDVPTAFGPFTPENFDGRFVGPVTATDALIRSRNIPAVQVASRLSSPDLYQFLQSAQVDRLASAQHYGLALVLGGGEVSMIELAQLYAMLSNDGAFKPLRLRESDPQVPGTPLLSAEASFMVRDMLRQNPRPQQSQQTRSAALPVAWKTGTSWGFRDAWTAGIVGPYVLITWVGNFDGSSNPSFIGIEAAAPLFFEVLDALAAAGSDLREPPRRWPLNLRQVEVCKASGDLPNRWCTQRGHTWFIPGKSPIRLSTVHRQVAIDIHSGEPACPPFDPSGVRFEVHEFWPSDLARVYAQAGLPRRAPPINPACPHSSIVSAKGPDIASPQSATAYQLRLSHPEQQQIALRAHADADVRQLYWFVDSALVASTTPMSEASWRPSRAGNYLVSVIDDQGRASSRDVVVQFLR